MARPKKAKTKSAWKSKLTAQATEVTEHLPPPSPRQIDQTELWLAPGCAECSFEDRTWCFDNVYEPCEKCGKQAVCYIAVPAVTELLTKYHHEAVPSS